MLTPLIINPNSSDIHHKSMQKRLIKELLILFDIFALRLPA
jgi:hypothetical protein